MSSETHSDVESDESDANLENYSDIINDLANKARERVIPKKSSRLYEVQYTKFKQWRDRMKIVCTNETTLLAYFEILSNSYVATSLWATYTKLKAMLLFKERIDISQYAQLQGFLKKGSKNHTVKKSQIFTNDEIAKFLNTADDDDFLLHKVVLILGLHGCLRKQELLKIKPEDIKQQSSIFQVSIPETKTGKSKYFYTSEEMFPVLNKYMNLRIKSLEKKKTDISDDEEEDPIVMERFLVQYRNKKCVRQHVGKGKLGKIPKDIATFLKLENPDLYTGHAFRRTSATVVADAGADILTLKRHGVWQSSTVVESYVNESANNKKAISKLISSSLSLDPKKFPSASSGNKPATVTRNVLVDKNMNVVEHPARNLYSHTSIQNQKLTKIVPSTSTTMSEKVSSKVLFHDGNMNMSDHKQKFKYPVPLISNQRRMNLTQIETEEFEKITQEEYEEILSTDFPIENTESKKTTKGNVSNILDDISDITQSELEEVISTQFFPDSTSSRSKQNVKKNDLDDLQNITQEELQEVASTDFLGNKINSRRQVFIFKNCNITIHQK